MRELNKYQKYLICRNRTDGISIGELCDSYDQSRDVVLKILRQNLALPLDCGLCPTSNNKKWEKLEKIVKKDMKCLSSNPYISLEQLNMRYLEVFNECVLNRNHRHTEEFLKSLSNNNNQQTWSDKNI